MRSFFEILYEKIYNQEPVVMVSITASSGSTPRGDGAHMLITREGLEAGTIGGGAVEYRAEQMAAEALAKKESNLHSFVLRRNEVEDLGMICGGDVKLFFNYLDPERNDILEFATAAKAAVKKRQPAWLIMEISDESDKKLAIYEEEAGFIGSDFPEEITQHLDSQVKTITINEKEYYLEQISSSGYVYIFGGGHVAQALVPILASVDFTCIVIDDREEFVQKELFPGVYKTIHLEKIDDWRGFEITQDDYICIMTRGHAHDLDCEYQALQTDARYIGVIGSKHKIAGVNKKLKKMGISDESLKRITTPIGLDIKAETPAEIAISITAELIEERASR